MPDPIKTGKKRRAEGSRTRYYAVACIAFLCLALILTQIFLHQTSVGSRRFVPGTFLLWTGTVFVFLALLVLATVLGRNLLKLYFERVSGQVGSRFKTKIVTTFVVLSLLPAVLLFLLAYGLINKSIEEWFSAPMNQMLEYSSAIAQQYYQETQDQANHFTARIAAIFDEDDSLSSATVPNLQQKLERVREQYNLDGVHVFDGRGVIAGEAGSKFAPSDREIRVRKLVASALQGKPDYQVEKANPLDVLREVVWATAPIHNKKGQVIGVVLTESLIPRSIAFQAYSVKEAYDKYQQLRQEKGPLRFTYLMILALSTMLIVFAFSWVGMYLAKRISVPIQALAEGAAEVTSGNLDYRVDCKAFDELDDLVISFNHMTAELQENKFHIEQAQGTLRQTNVELDDRRRYTETILQTIATGVIALDSTYHVRTMNRAALGMFDLPSMVPGPSLQEVIPESAWITLRILLQKSAVLGSVVREIELQLPGKTVHLATTVAPLIDSTGQRTGWVLVLDDVTELLRAERMAAWREVARRMAHEIKNPLTPIQLSAERILRRYRQILARRGEERPQAKSLHDEMGAFDNLLEECVRTITQEADSLKTLVDEFSRFARMPVARLEETDIHRILENTLSLYNGRIQDIRIQKLFGADVPLLQVDPEQMKRVFINLFDNALEAMAENKHAKVLQIQTNRNTPQQSVRIEIADTGRGFPREYQDSLFLPYFSTRKGGTGLGLSIVRQIISEHHGNVRAEANLPLGTKIVIDLPLAAA